MKKNNLSFKLVAVALVLTLSQLTLGVVSASPQITAQLITTGNGIKVNDNSVQSGATILTGATIETPGDVSATIQIGNIGAVEITPGTKVVINFTANNIQLRILRGCAALITQPNTTGYVVNEKGEQLTTNSEAEIGEPGDSDYKKESMTARSDGKKRYRFPVCGLVPAAGGAGAAVTGAAVGAAAGLSAAALGGIAAAVGGAITTGAIIAAGGDNSPSGP